MNNVGQTPMSREITLVTNTGCHLCEMAKDVIADASSEYPLNVRIIDLASPEGQDLARVHRMPFPPLILIDGKVHGHGRISAKKLRKALDSMDSRIAGTA